MEIREREIVGSGRDEGLFPSERLDWTGDWFPDGHSILLTSVNPGSGQKACRGPTILPSGVSAAQPAAPEAQGSSNWWLWLLLLIVLVVSAYFVFRKSSEK